MIVMFRVATTKNISTSDADFASLSFTLTPQDVVLGTGRREALIDADDLREGHL